MTFEEIIDHLDELEKFDVESPENRQALREAIALLRTHQNAQPNEPLTKGCDECEFCRPVCAQDGVSFLGCHYKPYQGKWVREIKTCPRPPKEA